jgi:hypothetical protein
VLDCLLQIHNYEIDEFGTNSNIKNIREASVTLGRVTSPELRYKMMRRAI